MHAPSPPPVKPERLASLPVLLSTLLAGLAELLPAGQGQLMGALLAPVGGYACAYAVRQTIDYYEYSRFCSQIDTLIAQMRAEATHPDAGPGRRLDLEDQIFDLLILKQKALLRPQTRM